MAVLFFDTDNAYEIIDRCQDLLPEWEKEGDQFWNRETGEIIRKDGSKYQDLVYSGEDSRCGPCGGAAARCFG